MFSKRLRLHAWLVTIAYVAASAAAQLPHSHYHLGDIHCDERRAAVCDHGSGHWEPGRASHEGHPGAPQHDDDDCAACQFLAQARLATWTLPPAIALLEVRPTRPAASAPLPAGPALAPSPRGPPLAG